ncbi:type I DNA topoisomerase [Candidatus Saccharibacteria bacterium]|nr:type I DNA topoisomerase [Candidatus Saccharibacteria bacterium]
MKNNLVIVESPAKAKTISKYLGSDFTVLSSVGHIRSIPKKAVKGVPPVDVKNGYKTLYEVDPDKKKIISELKKAAKAAKTIWLATDEDREGEAIAWHLTEVLGLDPKTTNRIVFHEITKSAIEEAIKHPRTIDMNLVQAQQARQILDRLVGFELSPVVWRKVPGGKSAGRVQSPAVRLLVEREREIEAFNGTASFRVTAEFIDGDDTIKAELSTKFATESEANNFLENLIESKFTVSDISTSPAVRNPGAPFTTSTLQQEANSRLGFSAKATMASAQKLYQDGKITYMRTDSVNLSNQAIAAMADYIKTTYGDDFVQVRKFKTKSANAQEAHEAIRPTDIRLEKASSNEYDQKLYDLIRRRSLASQMAPAKLEKTVITIEIQNEAKSQNVFEAKGEVILFDGFLKVYGASKKDAEILPAVKTGDELQLKLANARQVFSRPPARYSEGSLVKKLEDLGIGRPSTYATIINTIQVRGYVEKGEGEGEIREIINLTLENNEVKRELATEKTGADRGKLIPTASGEVLTDFLNGHFDQVIDYGFTAKVETSFDKIATGSLARNIMLDDFYKPFHELIIKSGGIERSLITKVREIGLDPKSGKVILARLGRFGPMLQLGSGEDKADKPQFAPMPSGRKIETVSLEEAIQAFTLPRTVGQTPEGAIIKANIGRFGPYIQIDKLFISIKPFDPHTITLEESLDLYQKKLQAETEKNIADFGGGIKVLNGRYGPYVTDGKKNAKIPKGTDPKSVSLDDAKKLLDEAPASKSRRRKFNGKKS